MPCYSGAVNESPLRPPAYISGGKGGMKISSETNFFPIRAAKEYVQVVLYEVELLRSVGAEPTVSWRQKM